VNIKAVAAANCHSVALSVQGEVYTWGDDKSGQLGHSHTYSKYNSPSNTTASSSSYPKDQIE